MEENNVYEKMHTFSGHHMSVVSVKFSPNGQWLASAGADKIAQVYQLPAAGPSSSSSSSSNSSSAYSNTDSASVIFRFEEHSAGLNDVAWLGDSHLVTASDDATIRVCDVEYQKCVHTYRMMKSFPYTLAINPCNKVISMGDTDGSIAHYHLSTKDHIAKVAAHASTVVSIAYNTHGDELISGSHDGTVRMWLSHLQGISMGGMAKGLVTSSQSSQQYAALCLRSIIPCPKIFTPISCVGFSPNEQYIYCSVLDSSHRLYHRDYRMDMIDSIDQDIAHGYDSSKRTTNPTHIRQYKGHTNLKHTIASTMIASPFEADQYCILSGSENGHVHLWDANSEDLLASVQLTEQGVIMGLDVFQQDSGDYMVASSGSDGLVKLWSLSARSTFAKPAEPAAVEMESNIVAVDVPSVSMAGSGEGENTTEEAATTTTTTTAAAVMDDNSHIQEHPVEIIGSEAVPVDAMEEYNNE